MEFRSDMSAALAAVCGEMADMVASLRAALDDERQALDAADADALDQAGATKAACLSQLEALDAERRQLQDELGMSEDALSTLPGWSGMREALAACHEQNEVNGAIVARRLSQVRGALAALSGAADAPATYGPGGHRTSPTLSASRLHI